jgi:hypothetical protein
MNRQDKWLITVSIDGKPTGTWDTFDGGGAEATDTKYKPGGMGDEISLGGKASVGNITLGRLLGKSQYPYMRSLLVNDRSGKARVVVVRQPLDDDGHIWGEPLTYTGTLMNIDLGATDSNGNAAQISTIVVSTSGRVS